jgi:hypothetical protein
MRKTTEATVSRFVALPESARGQTQKSGRSPGRSVLPSEADINQSYQSLRSRGIVFASSNSLGLLLRR